MNLHAADSNPLRTIRVQADLDWGEAGAGRPEGTVRAHIAELERNLEALRPKLDDVEYWKLKLLIHTHDTFKAEAKSGVAITGHVAAAPRWPGLAGQFCDDADDRCPRGPGRGH